MTAAEQELRGNIARYINREIILARTPPYGLDSGEQAHGIMALVKEALPNLAKEAGYVQLAVFQKAGGNKIMAKYRNLPIIVEATKWDGTVETLSLLQSIGMETTVYGVGITGISGLKIKAPNGEHTVNFGDWIIKGIKGEFYPVKPDIFEQTYEEVKDGNYRD